MENKATYDLFVDRRMLKETRYCCEKNYLMKKQLSVVERWCDFARKIGTRWNL